MTVSDSIHKTAKMFHLLLYICKYILIHFKHENECSEEQLLTTVYLQILKTISILRKILSKLDIFDIPFAYIVGNYMFLVF